jgi:nitrate reductase NapE component
MENEIKININNPQQLEKLYRDNQSAFVLAFNTVYEEMKDTPSAQVWNERLNFTQENVTRINKNEIIFIVLATFVGGLIAKVPGFLGIEYDVYLSKNIGFIVFPILSMYFIWKQKLAMTSFILPMILFIGSAIFINSLPYNEQSSTFILSLIHLPIFLWSILGYAFVGGDIRNSQKKIGQFHCHDRLIIYCGHVVYWNYDCFI